MKNYLRVLIVAAASFAASLPASAQLYEIANQIPSLIQPALSGSLNYKGYVDAGFTGGFGEYRANVLSVSTSQGFKYSNWFFMGAGIGLDVMFGQGNETVYVEPTSSWDDSTFSHSYTTTAFFLPIFTDFRFNIGANDKGRCSLFIGAKIGATFLLNNEYFRVGGGNITNRENFYFRPSLGVRIPVSSSKPSQAFNIGVAYQLITANWWYIGERNITLNSIGATIGFEW